MGLLTVLTGATVVGVASSLSSRGRAVSEVLGERRFRYSVDLGCGEGWQGRALKKHTDWLVGVDHRCHALRKALNNGYDEVVCADIRDYELPPKVDSVFLIEVIEHMLKQDGIQLLQRLDSRCVVVTTPTKFHPGSKWRNGHVSLWTLEDLEDLGFDTYLYNQGVVGCFLGDGMLAVRYS